MAKNSSACVAAVPVIPHTQGYKEIRFSRVIDPRTLPCFFAATCSFASIAVCKPEGHRRSSTMRALEFIHRFNHAIFRNVIDIATKQRVSVNSLLHRRENGEVLIVEKIAAAKRLLDGPDADVGQRHVPRVFSRLDFFVLTAVPTKIAPVRHISCKS